MVVAEVSVAQPRPVERAAEEVAGVAVESMKQALEQVAAALLLAAVRVAPAVRLAGAVEGDR